MLTRYDADQLMILQDLKDGRVGVRFIWKGDPIQITINANAIQHRLESCKGLSRQQRSLDHASKIAMRLLLHFLENNFEMIEWEVMSPAEVFMPYLVLPGTLDTTLKEVLIPHGQPQVKLLEQLVKPKKLSHKTQES